MDKFLDLDTITETDPPLQQKRYINIRYIIMYEPYTSNRDNCKGKIKSKVHLTEGNLRGHVLCENTCDDIRLQVNRLLME
jgi:hypothetical protein